jgi:hypothetical protein
MLRLLLHYHVCADYNNTRLIHTDRPNPHQPIRLPIVGRTTVHIQNAKKRDCHSCHELILQKKM